MGNKNFFGEAPQMSHKGGSSLVIAPSRGVGRFFLLTYHTTGESMLPLNTSSHIAPNKGLGVIAKERIKSGKGDSGKKKS